MIKQLPCHFVNHLVAIDNSALKLQPAGNKQGKDPKFPQNRSPISLLSSLGKIYEKILLEKLKKFVFTNNLIPDQKFGFTLGCSTQIDEVCYVWCREKDD